MIWDVPALDCLKKRSHGGEILRMLFDKVDQRSRVEADRVAEKGFYPFHDARSLFTYSWAS
jgi:hypothetical protein